MSTKAVSKNTITKTRVFLVDDHPYLREGIAQRLNRELDLTVCGQAGTAGEALAGIGATKPDLVLVDITLPGRDGLELIKDIKALHAHCLLLVLSMHDESLYAERVLRAGASGYVTKQEPPENLINAIRHVLAGEVVVGRDVMACMLNRLSGRPGGKTGSSIEQLSDRELEIFRLIGTGMQRKEIASSLNISVKTIETHRAHIREKLGLRTAAEVYQHAVMFTRDNAEPHPAPPPARSR